MSEQNRTPYNLRSSRRTVVIDGSTNEGEKSGERMNQGRNTPISTHSMISHDVSNPGNKGAIPKRIFQNETATNIFTTPPPPHQPNLRQYQISAPNIRNYLGLPLMKTNVSIRPEKVSSIQDNGSNENSSFINFQRNYTDKNRSESNFYLLKSQLKIVLIQS
ncbi:hypothetical protein HHI36_012457 [Cryptolaemus montrouzieri]|uniref:Uncharacterized protein n=1 Tax=Cryptolaemus montrouzieri TaxID=559131 RepID=A0ABD2NF81_9CUCU